MTCNMFSLMPLTSAEKSKRYRERLKQDNPEKFKEIQKKNLERTKKLYKAKTAVLTEEQKKERRKKWRQFNEHRDVPKQTNTDGAPQNTAWNESTARNIQRRVERNLRKENTLLRKSVLTLQKGYNRLLRDLKVQQLRLTKMEEDYEVLTKKLQTAPNSAHGDLTSNIRLEEITPTSYIHLEEITPQKRTDNFVNENMIGVETPKKDSVKKVVLAHNVLTDALKKQYSILANNDKNKLKNIVSSDLVKKYKLKTALSSVLGLKTGIKKCKIRPKSNVLRNKITAFYHQDDVSRASAGKKECVTFKKCKKQKRYLLDTLSKLHEKYTSEIGPVSLTTFKRFRPFYIVPPRIKDLETCVCLKHANMQFMASALKSCGVINTKDLNDIISKYVCDTQFKDCMSGTCDTCSDKSINQTESDGPTSWKMYILKDHEYTDNKGITKKTKKMVKEDKKGTVKELIQLFNSEMKKITTHTFNLVHQYQQYKKCIKNLESNEIAIHIDFSENWICKLNEEVQAMHFGSSKTQITLHTGVFYLKDTEKPVSFCSISPNNSHNPEAIWAHLDPVLKYIKLHYPEVDTIHFFSDGPTSQYRQKKNFFLLSTNIFEYGFANATWSFFEASHGKGAADGIGGAVKNKLDFKVAHGTDIPDAETAYDVLKETETAVKMFYVGAENIIPLDSKIVTMLTPLHETMKLHQVVVIDKHILKHRVLSCFCQNLKGKCECFSPKSHKFEIIARSEIQSEDTDYEFQLDENTGLLRKEKKKIDENGESKQVEGEDLLDFIEKEEVNNSVELNDSLVEFTEKEVQKLCNTNDEKYLKRKHTGDELSHTELKRPKKNQYYNHDSSEESSDGYSIHDSSTEDIEYLEDERMGTECPNPDIEMCSKQDSNTKIEITKDSHILVRFKLEKRSKYFLGQVLRYGKSSCEVKFLRHKSNGKFAWPVNDDVSIVENTDIVQVLPNPISERRGIKTFDLTMVKYKID